MSDDETRDDEQPAGADDAAATPSESTGKRTAGLRRGNGWRVPTPARLIEQRIASVARAIISGHGRADILQAVAKAQHAEAAQRDRVRRAALTSGETAEAAEHEAQRAVPVLWGDELPGQRTIDLYIRRAKDAIGDEGKKLSKQREYVLGMQLARCNEVYAGAFAAKRYATCVMVIREVNEMFGIREAIKVLLLGAADDKSAERGVDLKSETGKAAALSAIIDKAAAADPALGAVFARFARAQQLPAGALDAGALAIDLPDQPPPPKKHDGNGNGNGSNGSNGAHS